VIQTRTRPPTAPEIRLLTRTVTQPESRTLRVLGVVGCGAPGVGLIALVVALGFNRAALPAASTPVLVVLGAATAIVGLCLVVVAGRHAVRLVRGPEVIPGMSPEDARALVVTEHEIDADEAWWIETGDDGARTLLVRSGDQFASVCSQEFRSSKVGRRVRIAIADGDVLAIEHVGGRFTPGELEQPGPNTGRASGDWWFAPFVHLRPEQVPTSARSRST
jgi:hypothetical protein